MTKPIDTLMVFAAGFGTRMKAATKTTPKSLIKVHGKPILYYVLDSALRHGGFKNIFVNTHYLSDQIEDAVRHFESSRIDCPKITLLHEEELLDTGGTIKNGLKYFNSDAIVTHNSDVILKSDKDFFGSLKDSWDPEIMDFLMLVYETEKAVGYVGKGDFILSKNNQLLRPKNESNYPYMYTGAAILKPGLIASNPKTVFSLQGYYDNPQNIYGCRHYGSWCHLSSPEDIISTEQNLRPF
ncbi:MAG: nucleotidyltransferase family protein [Pseudomonadota bacterium]